MCQTSLYGVKLYEKTQTAVSRLVSLLTLLCVSFVDVVTLWLQHSIMVSWVVPSFMWGLPWVFVTRQLQKKRYLAPVNIKISLYRCKLSVELPSHMLHMITEWFNIHKHTFETDKVLNLVTFLCWQIGLRGTSVWFIWAKWSWIGKNVWPHFFHRFFSDHPWPWVSFWTALSFYCTIIWLTPHP